jgi:integration host factor subunit beta
MTKLQLAKYVAKRRRITREQAEAFVDEVFASIKRGLRGGERVTIRALGSFEARRYRAYVSRNPKTGVLVQVPPRRLPFLVAGKQVMDRLNAPPAPRREPPPAPLEATTWPSRRATAQADEPRVPSARPLGKASAAISS